MNKSSKNALLRGSAALQALAFAGLAFSAPAFAQAPQASGDNAPEDTIIVTGSITRNPAAATASPVVSITADDLQKRGIPTATEYLQTLTANNAGTIPPSWSAFGFTTGASAPSLRGFNNSYTLVLFDGMRTAVYPLADDTQRNIVDINTIPNSIIGNIDTLLDGASATYGSDAIAGVVNVITKREIKGLHLNGSMGISQRGDAGEQRISGSYGYGDIDEDGFNVYVSAEYQHNDSLYSNQRGYPFNTADLSRICGTAEQGCLTNAIRNGIQYDGSYLGFQGTQANAVRPFDPTNLTTPLDARYQYLNGCNGLGSITLTPDQLTSTAPANGVVCQEDTVVGKYQMYNAEITRRGGTLRATKVLGDSEIFAMFNYYNTTTFNEGSPRGWATSTAAGGRRVTVSRIFLPAYVCPQGTAVVGANPATGNISGDLVASGCNASNGVLNPNNPFAASGNVAQLLGVPDRGIQTYTNSKVYRAALGAHGTFGEGWEYNLGVTASKVNLDITNRNYIYLQGLMDAIAQGTYNFVNPTANSQAAIDQVFPEQHKTSTSKLFQIQGSLAKDVFELPGGMLNVAVGGQFRHESLNNPSSNPADDANPYARYYTINAVAVQGKRDIWSASYQVAAPILDSVRVKASGSYEHYSTGQEAFSPKFEAEFTPIKELKLRGTWSRGFRAPNFNESFQAPGTGYTAATIVCSQPTYAAFCAAHASNPTYYTGGYSPGLTSAGNPNLKPEKSTAYTLGAVFQPRSNMTFTVDYWRTKIKNLIVPASASAEIYEQYYTNNGVVNIPGITVIPGAADPQNPNALPLLGFIEAPFRNANAFLGEGIDLSADVKLPIGNTVTLRSVANASYLMKLQQENDDGTIWRADGTLGPCGWTSCSGAPKWRVTWQNTLDFNDKFSFTLTASYTAGYSPTAADSGGTYKDCAQSAADGQLIVYDNGDPVQCHVKATFNLDAHTEVKVADRFTLYADMLNVLNDRPPLDVNAGYAIYQFNPAWADRLFIGRYFRVGAKVDF
ncbi:TonB-dependent receptor [Sphingobium sp. 22B]|uniref:TonB-dependent receptor domain-containing protein n=1 Tax=unclassified Sphingobium TaxID=2611147 RepID=UPI0007823D66|nr:MULTISPECIES: TonB-dependent receptor [unclassified Sphingobium]KXU32760.1 TonB-dependent receptor [Sphingobium sp. AM]KYC32841.1 TonB-dependent receptor [Sphingobium sp. 22B]OAP32118.1 TonB-dependent receptor [Sphingobium sp. 20006FA]